MDKAILDELKARRKEGAAMGGAEAIAKLHARGKLTPRERLDILLDPGTFVEIGLHARSLIPELKEKTPADGCVTGSGKIAGRVVYVAAEDGSIIGGTRGRIAEAKTARMRELALTHGKPFIALAEAGAARVQEAYGAVAAGIGHRFGEHFRLSGKVPQVAAMMGACFGGPSFTAVQSDFVPIVNGTGFMGMSGPPVVKVGVGQEVSSEEIGGGMMSASETGQADFLAQDEEACLNSIRTFLSYFPSNCWEYPPRRDPVPAAIESKEGKREIAEMVPENHRRAYSMERLLRLLVDGGELFQIRELYGKNLITALGRVQGEVVGFVANNPMHRAGILDEQTAHKARKFVDTLNAFHIPLVFLMDCPGFLVGPAVERARLVSLAGRQLNSVFNASVPKITVVLRKAIGLAYLALCGRALGPDTIVAWPTARFDVMGPDAGIELVYGREIAEAPDPEARRKEIQEQVDQASSAYLAAEKGLIDDVIHPAETRDIIVQTLERCRRSIPPQWKHRIDP